MHLRSLLALVPPVVAAPMAALRGGSQRARVEYGRRRIGRAALRKPQEHAQIVDHLLEHSRPYPPLRLLVDRLPPQQVVGHVSPRAAGAHDPPQPVEDLAQIVLALGRVLPNEREIRSHERPLLIGNIAWVWFSRIHAQMLPFLS